MLWSGCIVVARYISVLTLFHCISSTALGSTQLHAERVALESAEQYAFGKPKLNTIFDAKRNAKFYAVRISQFSTEQYAFRKLKLNAIRISQFSPVQRVQ